MTLIRVPICPTEESGKKGEREEGKKAGTIPVNAHANEKKTGLAYNARKN